MLRRAAVLCSLLGVLAAPAVASADHRDRQVRRLAPVVAAEGPPGHRLEVRQLERTVCVRTTPADPAGECEHIPVIDPRGPFVLEGITSGTGRIVAAGATRSQVAQVEYDVQGGRSVRIPTTAAPQQLAGRPAGELRYFIGELPAGAYTRRLLDGDGRLLHETDEIPGGPTVDEGRPAVSAPVALPAPRGVRITAARHELLSPIAGDPGHRVSGVCISTRRLANDLSGDSRFCLPAWDAGVEATSFSDCDPRAHLVFLAAPRDVDRVTFVRGDGRALPARRAPLERVLPGAPSLFVAAPAGNVALRAVELHQDGRVERRPFGLPPATLQCGGFGSADFADTAPGPPADTVLGDPGGPALHVRDDEGGERLCLGVDRAPTVHDCMVPSPFAGDAEIDTSDDRRRIGGAVHPDITAVRVAFTDRGPKVTLQTVAGDAYRGRFAGGTRFVLAELPAGRTALDVELLDASGRAIDRAPVDRPEFVAFDRPVRPVGFVRGARGRATLAFGRVTSPFSTASCLILATGALPTTDAGCDAYDAESEGHAVAVDCTAGVAVVAGLLPRRARAVVVALADGRRLRGSVVRGPQGRRIGVVVLPPSSRARSIFHRTRAGRIFDRQPLRIPPATRQCGYNAQLFPARIARTLD